MLEKLMKLERDYADFGFDWPDTSCILKQISSELKEVALAIVGQESSDRIQEEMGDLLHAVLSLIRFNGFELNEILAQVTQKFESRCEVMKKLAALDNIHSFKGLSFEEMLKFWERAKRENYLQNSNAALEKYR